MSSGENGKLIYGARPARQEIAAQTQAMGHPTPGRALKGVHLPHLFLLAWGALLAGYAFLDRAFAYLGHSPVYVGEVVLALGIITAVVSLRRVKLGLIHWLLVLFILWGALRALPDLPRFGVNTLRDSVIWGYAIFALLVSWMLSPREFKAIRSWYARAVPFFLCWAPVAAFVLVNKPTASQLATGSGVEGAVKAGDLAVHLGGVAAFGLVGLYTVRTKFGRWEALLLSGLWIAGFLLVAAITRAGILAIGVAIAGALVLVPSRRLFPIIVGAVVVAALLLLLRPDVNLGGTRQVSISQLESNAVSIFTSSGQTSLEGTKTFRLKWWGKIVSYTVFGPYFWTGKGFGINLADSDGFQASQDHTLRSPHDSHMTVLARSGVPGLAIWIVLQLTFAGSLLKAAFRARRQGPMNGLDWYRIDIWIFLYWLVLIVNSSFDVYLEGPQGGIWFWSIMGVGIAALNCQSGEAVVPVMSKGGIHKVAPSQRG